MTRPRQRYALWLTGRILKILFVIVIVAITVMVLWRTFISDIPPSGMTQLHPNERLAAAYAEKGDQLQLFSQTQPSVTKAENNYGYFGVSRVVFIPEARQLQVVFRYNNSTLDHVQRDYELTEKPAKGDETLFDVTVVTVTDTTPDVEHDEQKARLHHSYRKVETTLLYTYVLFVFDDVDVTDATTGVFLDVYYREDIRYEKAAYGTLLLYNGEDQNNRLTLSDGEKSALRQYSSNAAQ
jgi:hypothetical protein